MSRRLTRAAATAVFLAVATSASAEVHKWVDDQGRVHFGDAPPPGTKAERLNTPPTSEPTPDAPARTWQEQVNLSNERRRLVQEREQKTQQQRQEYERRCSEARQVLATLDRERPIYRTNGQGEREYIDDGQRQAARQAANQRVATYCQ